MRGLCRTSEVFLIGDPHERTTDPLPRPPLHRRAPFSRPKPARDFARWLNARAWDTVAARWPALDSSQRITGVRWLLHELVTRQHVSRKLAGQMRASAAPTALLSGLDVTRDTELRDAALASRGLEATPCPPPT